MATLRQTFSDIASAIRAKGVSGSFKPIEMATKIGEIPSCGQEIVHENNLNLWRPDGTLLYSYTKDEVLNDGWDLPVIPDWTIEWKVGNAVEGYTVDKIPMTAQEWNWSKSKIVEMIGLCDRLDVCAIYRASDANLHMLIDMRFGGSKTLTINNAGYGTDITVEWGDRQTEPVANTAMTHTYSNAKLYHVVITTPNNITLGRNSTYTGLLGESSNEDWYARGRLLKMIWSPKSNMSSGVLNKYTKLDTLILPKFTNAQSNFNSTLYQAENLRFVGLPTTCSVCGNDAFRLCTALEVVSFSENHSSVGNSCCRQCNILRSAQLPKTSTLGNYFLGQNHGGIRSYYITSTVVNSNCLQNNFLITKVKLSQRTYDLQQYSISYCYSLEEVKADGNITQIGTYTFYNDTRLSVIDLHNNTSVPTLANINAFSGLASNYKIIVPDALYDDWIVATNWSDASIVSHIMKKSDWNAAHPDDQL